MSGTIHTTSAVRRRLAAAMLALSAAACQGTEEEPQKGAPKQYEIVLQSRTFTPEAGVPKDLAARLRPVLAGAKRDRAHVVVQMDRPPEPEDRARLARDGLELLEPINRYTWRAATTGAAAAKLGALKGVRWADIIEPRDKLARTLGEAFPLEYHKRGQDGIAYSVLFHKGVSAAEVTALARAGRLELEDFDAPSFPVTRVATVVVAGNRMMDAVARADIVAWVEPGPAPDENHNLARAQPLSNVDDVQALPFDLDGTGVTVGIWEWSSVVDATLLDLAGRVAVQAGQVATIRDHAQHVAGTVGASGANVPNALGMAPAVNIASWDHTSDTAEMVAAFGPGSPVTIEISNHSYGRTIGWNNAGTAFTNNQNLFGNYNNLAQAYDNAVFNTGLIVFKAAGNDRDDVPVPPVPGQPGDGRQGGFAVVADCIGPRGCAKNILTIGAMSGGAAIANFSCFGPTDDGRIKPDLVAEGVNMLSLGSSNFFSDNNGDGTDDVADSTTASYNSSGTSMASPTAAGVATLVLEQANALDIAMTPAAMRATLIQSARDVAGIGQSRVGPDYATGWGIVDAEAAVNLLRQNGLTQATLTNTGVANAWTRTFYVPTGTAEVHLTLAWTDPAGTVGGQILQNDLDLRLFAPNTNQFTPWILNPAQPGNAATRNGGNDAVNNVEQVSVLNPAAGVWTVRVMADAGNLPQSPQPFAVAGLLPRSDIVLVMDRSGSMTLPSGTPGVTKLAALQSAANEFVDLLDLGGGHRLGLVQFEEALVPFSPTFDLQLLSPANLADAHTAINSMVAGGMTNIIAGVDEASGQLAGITPQFPRQAIVVFSDGKHNRPLGSDLNSIQGTVSAGNDRFYSVGFGTDVNDEILSDVAGDSGGVHVNEQDLLPIQLTKYFLTVGALVHDMAVLSDPSFDVGDGESAVLSVGATKADQSLTFAINWTGQHAKDVKWVLQGPDKRCRIPTKTHPGLRVRNGKNYRLIRVDLPYRCEGHWMHAGPWTIRAMPTGFRDDAKETVDIMVLGDSRLGFGSRFKLLDDGKRIELTAALAMDGRELRGGSGARFRVDGVTAHVLLPLPPSGDSEKQDGVREGGKERPVASRRKERLKKVRLRDDGREGDRKAGDGVYTAVLRAADVKPGLLQARVVARIQLDQLALRRESTATVLIR